MPKKVKSFALEEEIYEDVSTLFKENYVDVNISYCVNKYLKELQSYLRAIEKELKGSSTFDVPMSYIIEQVTREPIFPLWGTTAVPGMTESPLHSRVAEFQGKYDINVKKYPDQVVKYDVSAIDDNVPSSQVIKFIVKAVIEQLTTKGPLSVDRGGEIAREIGGKGLEKKLREKVVPAFDRIDPVIGRPKKKPANTGK
jgi:hypothetical protein